MTEYYLVGFGFKGSTRLQGLQNKIPKAFHEVSTRFCKSYGAPTKFHAELHEGSTRTACEVHRAQSGKSGPDCTVGARSGSDCAVGPRSGPINYQAGIA